MKASIRNKLARAKRRIERRLERPGGNGGRPMFAGSNVRYGGTKGTFYLFSD